MQVDKNSAVNFTQSHVVRMDPENVKIDHDVTFEVLDPGDPENGIVPMVNVRSDVTISPKKQ